jgi:hypothetical protein
MEKRKVRKCNLPKYPMPEELSRLYRNPSNGLYEITELGITCSIPFELVSNLKMFFINYRTEERDENEEYQKAKMSDWINSLDGLQEAICIAT